MAAGRMILKALGTLVLCSLTFVLGWGMFAKPVALDIEPTDLSNMVHVPAGLFRIDTIEHELPGYWIDQFEVTESQWQEYAIGRPDRALNYPPFEKISGPDFPVRWVGFGQAQAFAKSLFKRLPTNLEWERAALGPNNSALPWGDAYVEAANTQDVWSRVDKAAQVTRVGLFERGRSAVGAYDMVGNVWEWTADDITKALRAQRNSESSDDSVSIAENQPDRYRLIRGGGFSRLMRGRSEIPWDVKRTSVVRAWDLGFRCVISDDEVAFQAELFPLLRDLGWKDPWHWFNNVRPATKKLVALGQRSLPYLTAARESCPDERLCDRIDAIVKRIREE